MGKIEDLEKLGKLKEDGIITESEFESEKAKILNENENVSLTTNLDTSINENKTENTSENINQNNDEDTKKATKAMTGFILGLCSIVAWFIPIIGFPVTITGIVFSAMGMSEKTKEKAIAGLVLSIIFLIFTLINSLAGAIIGSMLY